MCSNRCRTTLAIRAISTVACAGTRSACFSVVGLTVGLVYLGYILWEDVTIVKEIRIAKTMHQGTSTRSTAAERRILSWRALLPLVLITGMLALPASALAGGFTAHLFLSTHQPKVGKQPIKVTATRGRTKLSGSVSYLFFLGRSSTRVGRAPGKSFRNGVYRDNLKWPADAIGHTLTMRVVVKTRYGTDNLNWWIKVRR